jgi:hypothetical protein
MAKAGAPSAYRGYRLQALYVLGRMLSSDLNGDLVFRPEGIEDLDITGPDGVLLEAVQVKSYGSLALSDLLAGERTSFLHRAVELLHMPSPPIIQLVNFGSIGPELSKAWEGDPVHRGSIAAKLKAAGFAQEDIDQLFVSVQLRPVDESTETQSLFDRLEKSLMGVDTTSAFDLLHYWLYLVSERQGSVTITDLSRRIHEVGRFLAERHHYHQQWFTTIFPLEDGVVPEAKLANLREEFYAGVSARYEHIQAGLDLARDEQLRKIAQAFEVDNVVIIHAASGQGKSALAYRYMHDYYPSTWRYCIDRIPDYQAATSIAAALTGYANALEVPLGIYVDVSPGDTAWVDLARILARHPYIQILVSIREEDFRRATSMVALNYPQVELEFDEHEARLIYQRALLGGHGHFLDFDEAWEEFGGKGPLMEFVYLLTQTETLRQRLRVQIDRIRHEVRDGRLAAHELLLLRLVAVASTYETRMPTKPLIQALQLAEPSMTIERFEKEYLLRVVADGYYLEGLHPIRSRIMAELLTPPDVHPWREATRQVLPLLLEEDIERFLLHAFMERTEESAHLIAMTTELRPTTWTGIGGVLRSLLWAGLRDYVDSNRSAIDAARDEFGHGWFLIADLNFAGDEAPSIDNWWERFDSLIPQERQRSFEQTRLGQAPKENAFELVRGWLFELQGAPSKPRRVSDWVGLVDAMYWGVRLGCSTKLQGWLDDEVLTEAVTSLSLARLSEIAFVTHAADTERYKRWMQDARATINQRLAAEYGVVAIEEASDVLRVHYLPTYEHEIKFEEGTTAPTSSSDPFHERKIESVSLMRHLFPFFERYGAQGYGYRLGSFVLPLDSTNTPGVFRRNLVPRWPLLANTIAGGLARYRYRPNSWRDYLDQIIYLRKTLLASLEQLQPGLARFFERTKPLNIYQDVIDTESWEACRISLNDIPDLPKTAVDAWGFASENVEKTLGNLGLEEYLPGAIATRRYRVFLKAQQEYFHSMGNFFNQAPKAMLMQFFIGRLPLGSPLRDASVALLKEQGIDPSVVHLSAHNFFHGKCALPKYQQEFRNMFAYRLASDQLTELETDEARILSLIWQLWSVFAYRPEARTARAVAQIPNQLAVQKASLFGRVKKAIDRANRDGVTVSIRQQDIGWDGKPSLWIVFDVLNALELYETFEEVVEALRDVFLPIGVKEINSYLVEESWEYTVVVPLIRGRMINSMVWPLHTFTTLRQGVSIKDRFWAFAQKELPEAQRFSLGLELWETREVVRANQLLIAVASLISSFV